MAGLVPAADPALARRALVAPLVTAKDEDLFDVLGTRAQTAFTLYIVEGVVFKMTRFAGRSALELLGPGDLLAPRSHPPVRRSRRP